MLRPLTQVTYLLIFFLDVSVIEGGIVDISNPNHPFILQFLKFSKNILSIATSYLILSFTLRLCVFHYFIVSLGWILERQLNTSLCPSCLTDTSSSYHSKLFEKVLMFNNKKVA